MIESFDRLRILTLLLVGGGAVVIRRGVRRIDPDGLVIVGEVVVFLPGVGVTVPAVVVGDGILRIDAHRVAVVGDGAIAVALG